MHKKEHTCLCCFSEGMKVFHQVTKVPVNSVLNLKTYDQAVNFPRGDIALGFCERCGFISNVEFDPALLQYSSEYESTQSFSPTYNDFARRQAKQLIEHHNLYGKDLLDIGCGNGEFLTLLCEMGGNRGIGFDPAYKEGRVKVKKDVRVKFVKDYYSENYAGLPVDFVYCRMTLEHIQNAAEFVSMTRRCIEKTQNVSVFFQVPVVTRILRDCAFEDIYYEHCSYFSPGSLARLFRKCGFAVRRIETDYDGQYVMIDANCSDEGSAEIMPQENDLDQLQSLVKEFSKKNQSKLAKWKNQIEAIYFQDQKVVMWGSGSKGVAFLTTLGLKNQVEYVVDINPHRQGTYMAGTGQLVVAPDFLPKYKPDVVIIMNAIYQDEIRQFLDKKRLAPQIFTL